MTVTKNKPHTFTYFIKTFLDKAYSLFHWSAQRRKMHEAGNDLRLNGFTVVI